MRKGTDFFHLHCGMCGCPIVEVYRITGNSYRILSPLFSSHHILGASSDTSAVILGRGCHCANEVSPVFMATHVHTGTWTDSTTQSKPLRVQTCPHLGLKFVKCLSKKAKEDFSDCSFVCR